MRRSFVTSFEDFLLFVLALHIYIVLTEHRSEYRIACADVFPLFSRLLRGLVGNITRPSHREGGWRLCTCPHRNCAISTAACMHACEPRSPSSSTFPMRLGYYTVLYLQQNRKSRLYEPSEILIHVSRILEFGASIHRRDTRTR